MSGVSYLRLRDTWLMRLRGAGLLTGQLLSSGLLRQSILYLIHGVASFSRSTSFAQVLAFDDLLVTIEIVHWQIGLLRAVCVRLVMPRTVAPPFQITVIEKDLARVEHLLSFGQRRMTITIVQERLSFTGSHEVVLHIRDIDAVRARAVQPVLIGKTIERENVAPVHRDCRARMQVGIKLCSLNNSWRQSSHGCAMNDLRNYHRGCLKDAIISWLRLNNVHSRRRSCVWPLCVSERRCDASRCDYSRLYVIRIAMRLLRLQDLRHGLGAIHGRHDRHPPRVRCNGCLRRYDE